MLKLQRFCHRRLLEVLLFWADLLEAAFFWAIFFWAAFFFWADLFFCRFLRFCILLSMFKFVLLSWLKIEFKVFCVMFLIKASNIENYVKDLFVITGLEKILFFFCQMSTKLEHVCFSFLFIFCTCCLNFVET